jgi:hypothetical protein
VPENFLANLVIINKADLTTFLFANRNGNEKFSQICKIVDNTIILGDVIDIENDFSPDCFYDNCAYGLKRRETNGRCRAEVSFVYMFS